MKLNLFFDASIIKTKANLSKESFPLKVGEIYKAKILFIRANTLFFNINGQVFKTSNITTFSDFIFLKLIDNKDNYKFELIKDNIIYDKKELVANNLISLLKDKYSLASIEDQIKDFIYLNNENEKEIDIQNKIQDFIKNTIFKDQNQSYHSILKIGKDQYFHIEIKPDIVDCWSFSMHFELDGKKLLFIKGYYQKKKKKINLNFITNSYQFFSKIEDADTRLSRLNKNFIWHTIRRFDENISI